MHEIHCHRHGHSAGAHVISSRAHLSVKPDSGFLLWAAKSLSLFLNPAAFDQANVSERMGGKNFVTV